MDPSLQLFSLKFRWSVCQSVCLSVVPGKIQTVDHVASWSVSQSGNRLVTRTVSQSISQSAQ